VKLIQKLLCDIEEDVPHVHYAQEDKQFDFGGILQNELNANVLQRPVGFTKNIHFMANTRLHPSEKRAECELVGLIREVLDKYDISRIYWRVPPVVNSDGDFNILRRIYRGRSRFTILQSCDDWAEADHTKVVK
jgi:hypothetical protein